MDTDARENSAPGPRGYLLLGIFLVLVSALYLSMANGRFYFLEGASSGDIMLAKALAEGHGFREVWRVGRPPCTVRPPGLAFALSLVVRVAGLNLLAMKVVNNLFGPLAFLGAVMLLRRRMESARLGLVIAAFSFTIPFWIEMAEHLYSGAAYAGLALWSLWVFEEADERGFRGWALALVSAALVGCALMVRGIGMVVPAAMVLSLLLRKRAPLRTRMLWIAVIAAAVLASGGTWTLRNYRSQGALDRPYFSKLLVGEPLGSTYWLAEDQGIPVMPQPRPLTPGRFLTRLGDNSAYYLEHGAELVIPPLERAPRPLRIATSSLLLLLVMAGLLRALIRERRASEWFALLTLLVAWVWPFPHNRFFAPALPVLAMAATNGAGLAASGLGRFFGRVLPTASVNAVIGAVLIVGIAANLVQDLPVVRARYQKPEFSLALGPKITAVARRPEAYRSLILLDHVQKNTPSDATVMFHSIHPCGLIAKRVCSAVPMGSPGRVLRYLDEAGIDYVVMDDEGGTWGASYFSLQFLLPTLTAFPESFERVFSFYPDGSGPTSGVFRVKRSP